MESQYLIYALVDPRTEAVRYIGYSSRGLARPREHASQAYKDKNAHKRNWLFALQKLGLDYAVLVLEKLSCAEELALAEIKWIKRYRDAGANLLNATDGGEGTLGYHHTEKTKRKLADFRRGSKMSLAQKDNIRKSLTGRKATPEHCAKMSAAMKGKKHTLKARAKMSKSAKNRPYRSLETRRKLSEAAKKRWAAEKSK